MTEVADHILVQQALKGNTQGFAQLCRRYYPSLVAVAHGLIMDHHTAEDAAQEALAEAATRLGTLKRPERFGAWLTAICRNVARDMLKEHQRHRREIPVADTTTPAHGDESGKALLYEAIERLSPRLREVLMLRYFNQMTYEQMSNILGLSEQAVNGRLRRAKQKIAVYMKAKGFKP
jgi:RNA polymerase sigma-70 factor (ECF subfamily)